MGCVSGCGDYRCRAEGMVVMKHQFKPFDRVLVRNSEDSTWCAAKYSHFDSARNRHVMVCNASFLKCIPYEGNEHLVGTDKSQEEPETFAFGEHIEVRDHNRDAWFRAVYLWKSQTVGNYHRCATDYEIGDWAQCRKADW